MAAYAWSRRMRLSHCTYWRCNVREMVSISKILYLLASPEKKCNDLSTIFLPSPLSSHMKLRQYSVPRYSQSYMFLQRIQFVFDPWDVPEYFLPLYRRKQTTKISEADTRCFGSLRKLVISDLWSTELCCDSAVWYVNDHVEREFMSSWFLHVAVARSEAYIYMPGDRFRPVPEVILCDLINCREKSNA